MNSKLYLHEEILLLALNDEKGTIHPGASYHQALAGAIVAELMLSKRIQVEENKRKKIIVIDPTPIGDQLLDECLAKIQGAKRLSPIMTWIGRFSSIKQLKHRVAWGLVLKGILKAEEDCILFFKRTLYPEVNPEPEQKLIGRLREAILTDIKEIDPRTVVLISLAKSTGLLKTVADKKEQKDRKKRIEALVNGEVVGKAAKEAIEAMQAAIMVATIMPAITASTTTT